MTDLQTRAVPERKRKWPVLLSMAVVVGLVAAGLAWFFADDAPSAVDLATTASAGVATSEPGEETSTLGVDGAWIVDTSVGTFDLEGDTTATFAGFRVNEVMVVGDTVAVGRTPAVTGSITIEGDTLTSAEITADLTAIRSNASRREKSIQEALGTTEHPNATFVLTEPIELGEEAVSGEPVSVPAVGELTINGVTNSVEIQLDAQLIDGSILITGTTDVMFADYEIEIPASIAVVSVEDHGIVELQLWLTRNTPTS